MARRRGNRILVYTELAGGLKYGFQTQESIHNAYKAILGQTTYEGAAGVFFGANSPKPGRASKEFASGRVSSFCSSKTATRNSLRADGWTISRGGSNRGVKLAGKTRTVYVDMPGGYKYAWNLTRAEVAEATGELGVKLATGNENDLIWGSTPKPPRAQKQTAAGSVSTFSDPSEAAGVAAAEAGWTVGSFDPKDSSGA